MMTIEARKEKQTARIKMDEGHECNKAGEKGKCGEREMRRVNKEGEDGWMEPMGG